MNRWTGIGRVTKHPKLSYEAGQPATTIRLSVRRAGVGGTDGHFEVRCVDGQALRCADIVKVGRQVAVDGRLEFEEVRTVDGSYASRVYIVAERIELLGRSAGA